ncbi:UbiD family decarboxylase [Streptomyces sp. NPDC048417]|uniref:UbiD family decarboxylase n=1 Tax=Streptomyces sp. NPDC048417 TaxID=3155387 RepID=UPI0034274940
MSETTDFRSYLARLEELGDLQRISRVVDPDLEASAVTRRSTENGRPAPFFEHLKGAGEGFRMVGAPGALSSIPGHPLARISLSLGLPYTTTAGELVERLAQAGTGELLPPRRVSGDGAPCKEHVLTGDDARLDRFPIPVVHEGDGGPYVNTWGVIVARTPDGRWTNWSISRIMMIDGRHMTGLVLPGQHLGMIWREWEAIGQPMPYALFQGGDPGAAVVGGMTVPTEVDEGAYLGALLGRPVDVVKCETNDLEVPASAEVVIEGHLSATRDAVEGPFAEFHGWALPETSPQPLFGIEAITYRSDPVWPLAPAGRPVDDSHVAPAAGISAEVVSELRKAGIPVTTAWLPLGAACFWTVITVPSHWRELMPGMDTARFVHRIGEVLNGTRVGRLSPVVYVLDDDVDPAKDSDLLWALATRVHPTLRQEQWHGPIMPWYPCFTEEELHNGWGAVVVHDALLPAEGHGRAPQATFDGVFPADVRAKVLAAEAEAEGGAEAEAEGGADGGAAPGA